jgi:hypothetical protein
MKLLSLSNSTLQAIVDDDDFERCLRRTWTLSSKKKKLSSLQIRCRWREKNYNLSNFVMKDFKLMFDHKNRNALDNRKENLRPCNHPQNHANMAKPNIPTSSRYKGVYWYKPYSCWKAKTKYKQKDIHIGYFDTEKAAARAYDKKAKEIFGEFAYLNFPEDI